MKLKYLVVLTLVLAMPACAADEPYIEYLGNEGVALIAGESTILFDPLFQNDYGHYSLVPDHIRTKMFDATGAYEQIDLVFVSHHHGDHFHPADMIRLLEAHPETTLIAPQQAVDAMRELDSFERLNLSQRIRPVQLAYGDDALRITIDGILIDAFYVPHSGWPNARTDVQNISYRVSVKEGVSIAHFGDADPNHRHFENDVSVWHERPTTLALPPYWFFNSTFGNDVLETFVQPAHSIGIHVPANYANPGEIPDDLQDYDLFLKPGEIRKWRSWLNGRD